MTSNKGPSSSSFFKRFLLFFLLAGMLLVLVIVIGKPVVQVYPGPVQVVDAGSVQVLVPTVLFERKPIWAVFSCTACTVSWFSSEDQAAPKGSLDIVNKVLSQFDVPPLKEGSAQTLPLNAGPSAELGVILAAYMDYYQFSPLPWKVAATGAVTEEGNVVSVVGVEQKLASLSTTSTGASSRSKMLFFTPPLKDAIANPDVIVYSVNTVDSAIDRVCAGYSRKEQKALGSACPALS